MVTYDCTTLPPIVYPMTNTHIAPIKCLGNRAIVQEQLISINILASSNEKMQALYLFWRDDCNYGLDSFLVSLPLFGMETLSTNEITVRFKGDFISEADGGLWTQKIELVVVEPFKEVTYGA